MHSRLRVLARTRIGTKHPKPRNTPNHVPYTLRPMQFEVLVHIRNWCEPHPHPRPQLLVPLGKRINSTACLDVCGAIRSLVDGQFRRLLRGTRHTWRRSV